MKKKMMVDQFVGIFPNSIELDLCDKVVKWFDSISKQGLTITSFQDGATNALHRRDESIQIPSALPEDCFPVVEIYRPIMYNISQCIDMYFQEFDIARTITSTTFKAHRVHPTGGYHTWHHEQDYRTSHRILVWHVNVEVPKRGGEIEFLWQSLRIEPKVGQLLIWPAGFTHKHRGLPPLEGQKTYLTGGFNLVSPPPNQ